MYGKIFCISKTKLKGDVEVKDEMTQGKANLILAACAMFNLSIGVLYAWSVFKRKLEESVATGGYGWTATEAGFPYVLCIALLAIGVLIGGRLQDKLGPKLVLSVGGAMVGLGMILSGLAGNNVAVTALPTSRKFGSGFVRIKSP